MANTYTFNSDTRYITRGISEQIPLEIQLFMWQQIDTLIRTTDTLDYLQVFEIRTKDSYVEIEHRQEVPDYKKIHKIKKTEAYASLDGTKIFVIDDITHSTMLLAIEY